MELIYKKQILQFITVILCVSTFSAFSQKKVILNFDTAKNEISKLKLGGYDLNNNQTYVFRVCNVNNAFHKIKFKASLTNKTSTFPSALQTFVQLDATVVAPEHAGGRSQPSRVDSLINALTGKNAVAGKWSTVGRPIANAPEFEILEQIISGAQDLTKFLGKNWTSISACQSQAKSVIHSLAKKMWKKVPEKLNQNDFQKMVDDLTTDFLNVTSILKSADGIPPGSLIAIYDAESYINSNLDQLKSASDILFGVANCADFIESPAYNATSDFLDLNATAYSNKFSSSPDSLMSQTIGFYRKNKIKIDVTSGFFVTNLGSKSYYFKDTLKNIGTEATHKLDVSFGALFHLHYLVSSYFKAGVAVGAAVSFLDGKTKYLLGPSFVFGRKKEFSISGGWALASIPIPSQVINQTGYKTSPSTAVPTVNDFSWGGFLGLSYSIISSSSSK